MRALPAVRVARPDTKECLYDNRAKQSDEFDACRRGCRRLARLHADPAGDSGWRLRHAAVADVARELSEAADRRGWKRLLAAGHRATDEGFPVRLAGVAVADCRMR